MRVVAATHADASDDLPIGHDGEAAAEDDQSPSGPSRPSGLPARPPYARSSSAIPGLRYDMLGHSFFSSGRMLHVAKNPRRSFPGTQGSKALPRLMEGG